MKKIQAQFEINTPMFLRGNQDDDKLSIRPPSIKGALRFWWRALSWPRLIKNQNQKQALQQLHKEEALLFGAATSDQKGGQGLVRIKVLSNQVETDTSWKPVKTGGSDYLLGQGVSPRSGYIKEKSIFEMELLFSPKVKTEQVDQIMSALWAFGLLGGLGARQRKGLGSISVQKIVDVNDEEIQIPTTVSEYLEAVKSIYEQGSSVHVLPPFTALSGYSQSDISLEGNAPLAILENVGNKLKKYRESKKSKGDDKRLVFGLPNDKYKAINKDPDKDPKKKDESVRRTSPLFLHVHKVGNKYLAVQTLLPAKFLHDYCNVTLNKKRDRALPIDWQVIRDYLELPEYKGATDSVVKGFTDRQPIFKGSLA